MFVYLFILLFGAVASFFGPWWAVAPLSFVVCLWKSTSPRHAFLFAAAAGTTLWWGYSAYNYVMATGQMADQVMQIFTGAVPIIQKLPVLVLIFVFTALIIGLVSGFSGLAGERIRRLMH